MISAHPSPKNVCCSFTLQKRNFFHGLNKYSFLGPQLHILHPHSLSLSSSSTNSCDQQCKLVLHPPNRPINNNNVNKKSPGKVYFCSRDGVQVLFSLVIEGVKLAK